MTRSLSATHRPSANRIVGVAVLFTAIAIVVAGKAVESRRLGRWEPTRTIMIDGVTEISGIVWMAATDTFLTVGDEGNIAELSIDGRILRKTSHIGCDFEDLVVVGPDDIRVIEERYGDIFRIDITTLDVKKIGHIDRPFGGNGAVNRGYEGLTFVDGVYYLAHEDKPVGVIEAAVGASEPARATTLAPASLSGIVAVAPDTFLLIARSRGVALWKKDGGMLTRWTPLPGTNIEGGCLVPGQGLFLCEDAVPSVLYVYEDIRSFADLERFLRVRR